MVDSTSTMDILHGLIAELKPPWDSRIRSILAVDDGDLFIQWVFA